MCLNPYHHQPLTLLLLPILVWMSCSSLVCTGEAIRKAKYQTFTLASVCPQLRPGAFEYTENDVYRSSGELQPTWERKTINLGLGVAALLDETLNSSLWKASSGSSSQHIDAIDCSFEVTTGPESRGIFVVLSQLNALRRWKNGSCQDYLQINYANFYSASICGPVGQPGESILSFDSSIGVVKVHLHLSNSTEEEGSKDPFLLRMKLVLTSYFDCAKERDGFSCTKTNERCIPSEYVGDGLVNCDMPSCRDEQSCLSRDVEADEMYNSLYVTILIGLVSFISTGLLFGLLLWFCLKRNFKQRMQASASSPNLDMELSNVYGTPQQAAMAREGSGRRRPSELEGIAGGSGGGAMAEGGTLSATADPPPSYDILFPDK